MDANRKSIESQPKVNLKSIESQPKANGCLPKVIINRESFALLQCCILCPFSVFPQKKQNIFCSYPAFLYFCRRNRKYREYRQSIPSRNSRSSRKSRKSRPSRKSRKSKKSRKSRSSIPSNPKTNKKPSSCHFLSTLLFLHSRR